MNVFIVDLKNEPGTLAKLAEAISEKGINIELFSGVTCGDSGSVALATNDEAATRKAISGAGFRSREIELVDALIDHKPGALAGVVRKLADAGVNIVAALPAGMSAGKVSVAFATDQPDKARAVLGATEPAGISVG